MLRGEAGSTNLHTMNILLRLVKMMVNYKVILYGWRYVKSLYNEL